MKESLSGKALVYHRYSRMRFRYEQYTVVATREKEKISAETEFCDPRDSIQKAKIELAASRDVDVLKESTQSSRVLSSFVP
jgi:hypothetical protein